MVKGWNKGVAGMGQEWCEGFKGTVAVKGRWRVLKGRWWWD